MKVYDAWRSIWTQFRGFAFRGSVLDLAVAVVLGTAFNAVVNAVVKSVVMPLFSYIVPAQESYRTWKLGRVELGVFVGETVNFIIIAAVLFVIVVKLLGSMRRKPAPPPPATRQCPMCLSAIPLKAQRCPHCTSAVVPVQ